MARLLGLLVVAAVATSLATGSASAAPVSGRADDPQDTPPVLAGSGLIDIRSVDVAYDPEAGSVAADVRFYRGARDRLSNENLSVVLGTRASRNDCAGTEPSLLLHGLPLEIAGVASGSASLTGHLGTLQPDVTYGDDDTTVRYRITHPALAGRGWKCAVAEISYYDDFGHCAGEYCEDWEHSFTGDTVGPFALRPPASAAPNPPTPASPAPSARRTPRTVLVNYCGLARQSPKTFVIACADAGYRLAQLRWSNWGDRVSTARGVAVINQCDPFCAAGNYRRYRVSVRASRRAECGTRRAYRLVTIRFIGDRPQGRVPTRLRLGCR